jgi:hypothetical protein
MYRSLGGEVINMTSVPEVKHWIHYCWCKENVQGNRICRLYLLAGIPSRSILKNGCVFLLGWKGGEAPVRVWVRVGSRSGATTPTHLGLIATGPCAPPSVPLIISRGTPSQATWETTISEGRK